MFGTSIIGNLIKGIKRVKLVLLGPAFVAAIGYIDPGNFVTNIQAGTAYGYKLLWVIVWANIMGMVIQLMSAKLGIVTGKNLAEHIRDRFSPPLVWFYWIQAEIIAIATDLAEFLGASLGFKLLLDITLFQGAILTGIATFLILFLQNYGQKYIEIVVGSLLIFVAGAYAVELFFSKPKINELFMGIALPVLPNLETVFFSAAILGATIMPHVIYLHSALTQSSDGNSSIKERYTSAKLDVIIAMTIAGFVNLAIMATAAAVFHFSGFTSINKLDQAYLTLKPILGQAAATIFSLSLVVAGLSSTVVGTMAGQVVMQGFVHFKIPLWFRRTITMIPSFIVIWVGWDIAHILILSQVFLSFGIALALVPLISFTSNHEIMGDKMANSYLLHNIAILITLIVVVLNVYLIVGELMGNITPF
ncbi:divalent metal cation transporter [Candidatus Pantoea edessiphila]|uniref:Divalent metal cation transporter MntH n=1 Tax=Candidatus Pantoea edessiphila TaxID=2044610 RepID=A0A2P5T2T5_9GAMM|nr:Nramp family divalent metal transporter [Candidatus Pantoea edessiphila]PPI88901.1 divalent metal cation transporter [Candidatus Pantoea edessiphila]